MNPVSSFTSLTREYSQVSFITSVGRGAGDDLTEDVRFLMRVRGFVFEFFVGDDDEAISSNEVSQLE
jgi:hypothetical protein